MRHAHCSVLHRFPHLYECIHSNAFVQYFRVMEALASTASGHIKADSVVDLAYQRIRSMVIEGEIPPGARLGQVELAEQLGISRTPVREALRRLTGEGLAEFVPNRGFRAASPSIDDVLRRLEVRSLVEPGIARLAAARRSHGDLLRLQETIEREAAAETRIEAHDASREFHLVLAGATGNPELVSVLASLWIVEIGRRLLAARATSAEWRAADVAEHRAIATAVGAQDGDLAARLMAEHVAEALQHWQHEPHEGDDAI
jgi:DNA-binding GntR family transcriptional regulator